MPLKQGGLFLQDMELQRSQESLITNTMTLQVEMPIYTEDNITSERSATIEKIRVKDNGVLDRKETTKRVTFQSLRIGRIIGEGSQAKVRKALHVESGVIYALKQFTGSDCVDSMKKVFEMELRKVVSLPFHENLVNSIEAFFRNGHFMILMEYMKHGTLKSLYRKKGFLLDEVLKVIAKHLLSGLSFLEKCGIVHRDIKPSNILLSENGVAKISDFGVSTYVTASILQNTVSSVGSQLYMAPERLRGDPYSFPSDIWSLGLTIAECRLGTYPFAVGENIDAFTLCDEIAEGTAKVIWNNKISHELIDFVNTCLTFNPHERPSASTLLSHPFVRTSVSNEPLINILADM